MNWNGIEILGGKNLNRTVRWTTQRTRDVNTCMYYLEKFPVKSKMGWVKSSLILLEVEVGVKFDEFRAIILGKIKS